MCPLSPGVHISAHLKRVAFLAAMFVDCLAIDPGVSAVNAAQHLITCCCLGSELIEYLRKNVNRISYPFVCEGQTSEHGAPKVGFRPSLRSVLVGSSVSTQGRALPLPNEFHPESCSRSPLDESQHFLPLADP